ncbi:replication initiation negative regulator SeqA [Colwellia sp. D2M02]|uniref:replication initiation negative regulator SeqA n=1 Tax=Colwellia sp. D2M02 TaxID=2841562 RepID=UPI001C09F45B|nr:replication initiation negative regulator SeqA [Colwellia sp. D2M02]MBU2892205.1 replication initiation negative regulator SeqA [Colwellia sp. D2M02]
MKNIEIDEELYQFIATNTQFIGESASAILRRLLNLEEAKPEEQVSVTKPVVAKVVESTNDDVVAGKPTTKPATKAEKVSSSVTANKTTTPASKEITSTDNITHDSVFNFINKEELAMQRGAVGRFLLILAALYRAHPQQFDVVTDISGRDRLYFADSESELAESGSSTKPRQIPDSPFWVITNSNTTRKKMMLTKAAMSLGYSDADVEKIRELL